MTHLNSSMVSDAVTPVKPAAQVDQSTIILPIQTDELLTIAEVALYLKLSRRTDWRWCKSGQLTAVKVGHQWRVARSDLEKFVRRRGKLML